MGNWYPEGTLEWPFEPQDISAVEIAFPANVGRLMPPEDKIPDEFKGRSGRENTWVEFQHTWFYKGLNAKSIKAQDGIDKGKALAHLAAIQGSWEPKHEYKEAAVAFLASLWFKGWK